ncbi:MAG: sigma-70 family RNA polymerase sigma factor [Oscillospiraceae bacterium]|nr:sigma-70 family RNA polymerase sigma factor [Oscillospiraceae bacterium]
MEFSLKTSESFDEVMRHYTPTVYRIAFTRLGNAADAEDVSQDVFVRYFKADLTFESEEHRKAWLLHCAVNCANSFASSAWKRHNRDLEGLEQIPDERSVEESAERSEARESVLKAVMQLPPKYRTVVYLFYFEDLSTMQISNVIKVRESTVRSQLSRAREQLKKMLKKYREEAEFDEF